MAYDTDAGYLIQGGKDLGDVTVDASRLTAQFNSESHLPWHEWGAGYATLGTAYDEAREATLDCMEETVALLAAYAVALQATGAEYLAMEENAQRLIEGDR